MSLNVCRRDGKENRLIKKRQSVFKSLGIEFGLDVNGSGLGSGNESVTLITAYHKLITGNLFH